MNYKKVYERIIENRLKNPLSESEYGERHHIIPRSLGGSDRKNNLVRLSAREHFICHALLTEMYEHGSVDWIKMNLAFMMMKGSRAYQNRYFNSRLYEIKRKDFSRALSISQQGEKNSNYGKPMSEEARRRISNSLRRGEPKIKDDWDTYMEKRNLKTKAMAQSLWEEFINGDFTSLNQFSKISGRHQSNLTNLFIRFIPEYSNYKQRVSIKKQMVQRKSLTD